MANGGNSASPTIHEVARLAGVSISSVSRALNGHTTNEDIVERVRHAVDALGYVPSSIAQSFKHQRTGQVAFAMADIGNPFYLDAMRAIQPVLKSSGLRLILHSTDGIVSDEVDLIRGLKNRFVDGLILCPIRVTDELLAAIDAAPVPVVVLGSLPGGTEIDEVRSDSYEGAKLGVQHLVNIGCTQVGLIDGPTDTRPGHARLAGFEDGLEELGLSPDREAIQIAEGFEFDDGVNAATKLINRRPDLDGILVANDLLALGSLRAFKAAGRSVPDDIRVVGMDDTWLASVATPPLTSVNLGAATRGAHAAKLLLERLNGDPSPARSVDFQATLTVRESA